MDILNRVMIAGNLTRDPEVRETGSGKAVAHLTLALDPPGARKREEAGGPVEAIFVEVELWEQTAETAAQYLKKGSTAMIEGRLKMDRWEDRESGKIRSKLKVVGERLRFLNLGGREGDRPEDSREPHRSQRPARRSEPTGTRK